MSKARVETWWSAYWFGIPVPDTQVRRDEKDHGARDFPGRHAPVEHHWGWHGARGDRGHHHFGNRVSGSYQRAREQYRQAHGHEQQADEINGGHRLHQERHAADDGQYEGLDQEQLSRQGQDQRREDRAGRNN
eukprot:16435853-Heterocapsa_arctica.AAC.1